MSLISTILLIVFIPVCILLILIVLLQAGKGGGLAGAFGGGGGQAFLGARGAADFLSKLTIYLAIAFMFLSLVLSLTYGKNMGGGRIDLGEDQPAVPAGGTPAEPADAAPGAATEGAGQPETPAAGTESETPSPEGGN